MIKLMIADDEPIVLESIQFIIEKYVQEVRVVGTAASGREAIEKALDLKPDVMLMDIRMPGINGIEAIRQIKECLPHTSFVIITAHEYFEYAKEAVNLGVQEYLIKPLNKGKLIDTLQRLSQMIVSKREMIQREIALREKIHLILPHMEGQFIYSQLFDGSGLKDLDLYEELFQMDLTHGYVLMALVEDFVCEKKEAHLKNRIQRHRFYEDFSQELKALVPCLIGPPLLDRVIAYLPVNNPTDTYGIRNHAVEIATQLAERIAKRPYLSYRLGIGKCYGIESFSKSYDEAYRAAALGEREAVTHFEDIQLNPKSVPPYPVNKEKLMIQWMLEGNMEGALSLFEEIFAWLQANYQEEMDCMKAKLLEMFFVVKRTLAYEGEENDLSGQVALLKITQMEELKIYAVNFLKGMITTLDKYRKREYSGLIREALDYIHAHYNREISLDEVAKAMNMSYHYFSKFFKETTGQNFIDYLTELRVEKSKELLKDLSLSIKNISYDVGYSDPNYFSKLFKRITGITPTEYRENIIQGVMG